MAAALDAPPATLGRVPTIPDRLVVGRLQAVNSAMPKSVTEPVERVVAHRLADAEVQAVLQAIADPGATGDPAPCLVLGPGRAGRRGSSPARR